MFYTWSDLGSEKHRTEAEIADACRVLEEIMKKYKCRVSSIAVDNAARSVAEEVCKRFPKENIMMLRDPGHCIDLLMKDLMKTAVVKRVVDDGRLVRKLVSTDRISAIKEESIEGGEIYFAGVTIAIVETRINLVHDFLLAA